MRLLEAKQILKKAGYITEGSMSLKDKIANAKRFTGTDVEEDLEKLIKVLNSDYKPWKFNIDACTDPHGQYGSIVIRCSCDEVTESDDAPNLIIWQWHIAKQKVYVYRWYDDPVQTSKTGYHGILYGEDLIKNIKTLDDFADVIMDETFL